MNDLARRVATALERKGIPAKAPVEGSGRFPEDAELVGHVPMHLRGLYLLRYELRAEANAEKHRRCVEILGKESYDNEHVEYAVHCDVEADPLFGGERTVLDLFGRSLKAHFQALATNEFGSVLYGIGSDWELYALKGAGRRIAIPPLAVIIE